MDLHRRAFLFAAAGALALPWLEQFAGSPAPRRRMVLLCAPLGFHPDNFFPEKAGRDYVASPYLEELAELRQDFTVISGLSHAGTNSSFGHQATASFLTGAPGAGRPGFRNSISLDQLVAERIGGDTRFPSLVLAGDAQGLSWTRTGAPVPAANSPSAVFARLFLADGPAEAEAQRRRLADGRSILDDVRAEAKRLRADLGAADRDKLDEYATSVRELETRLAQDERWLGKPKPSVDAAQPKDVANPSDLIGRTRLLFDLTHLALQTDSTRVITIMLGGAGTAPPIPGVSLGHHDLTHHGKEPSKLAQLKLVETELIKVFRDLLLKLRKTSEEGESLLARTSVFLGSNLGDANSHATRNLPVLLAGGGFQHGQHLAFDPADPPPLCNLFVSLLQRLGLPIDRFASSTGTLTGLS